MGGWGRVGGQGGGQDWAQLGSQSRPLSSERGRALWQTTEHVASPWPLNRKPFPYLPPPWLTDGPGPWVTADHWGSFMRAVNRIRKDQAGVRSETGDLWPPLCGAVVCGICVGCAGAFMRLRLADRWQIRLIQQLAGRGICVKTDHTDERKLCIQRNK